LSFKPAIWSSCPHDYHATAPPGDSAD